MDELVNRMRVEAAALTYEHSSRHATAKLLEDGAKALETLLRTPAAHTQGRVPTPTPWPKQRDTGRLDDMHPDGHLRVLLDADNDVIVEVFDGDQFAAVEFCNPGGGGGGRSTRTRMALIELMVAMQADNAESPNLDWWARRLQAAPDGSLKA